MFTPEELRDELAHGPVYIRDKTTKEVYKVDGIFMTPSIAPVSIETGKKLVFGYGGQTWAEFEMLVAKE